jgi:hypothetical protein
MLQRALDEGDPPSRFATTAGKVRLRALRLRRDKGPGVARASALGAATGGE